MNGEAVAMQTPTASTTPDVPTAPEPPQIESFDQFIELALEYWWEDVEADCWSGSWEGTHTFQVTFTDDPPDLRDIMAFDDEENDATEPGDIAFAVRSLTCTLDGFEMKRRDEVKDGAVVTYWDCAIEIRCVFDAQICE